MASLYDSASLVMIPSGYKDDKLYSIKPTNGDGDFTFSRDGAGASPATRVNASGLIEKGRENALVQSNTFNTTWSQTATTSIVGGQSGYDGSSDAWLWTAASGSFTNITQSNSIGSGVVTLSVYAKAGNTNFIALQPYGSGAAFIKFNLSTGAVHEISGSPIDYGIESVGGGWYRCFVTDNYTSAFVSIYLLDSTGNFSNSATDSIYIQDAQLEQGLISTSYIETTTAPVSAGLLGDMPRLDYHNPDSPTPNSCPNLLLEPSRVNSFIHSEYFSAWSKVLGIITEENSIISPEGVLNATKMIRPNSTSGAWMLLGGTSVTIGQNQVASCFVKEGDIADFNITYYDATDGDRFFNFDISTQTISGNGLAHATYVNSDIEDYGNGWYRCYVVVEAGNATPQIQFAIGDNRAAQANKYLYIYGAQHEQNASYPTSYIPTYGSASTRGADVSTTSSVPSLIGQTEGTIFWQGEVNYLGADGHAIAISGSTSTFGDAILLYRIPSGSLALYIQIAGVPQFGAPLYYNDSASIGADDKYAIGYAQNDLVVYKNGTQIMSSTSGNIPATNFLLLNEWNNNFIHENKTKQALLFKTRLTNAELAALTA